MQLIARKSFSYGGRSLQPGDQFDATDKHGKLLKALRKADYAAAGTPPAPGRSRVRKPAGRAGAMQFPEVAATYGTRAMKAED